MTTSSPFLSVFELGIEESEHPVKPINKLGSVILGILLVGGAPPLWVCQCSQGDQATSGRPLAQRPRRTVRPGLDAPLSQFVGHGEPQCVGEKRSQDDDFPRRGPLFVHQLSDLVGGPVEHLRMKTLPIKS